MITRLVNCLIGVAALALSCMAIHVVAPFPEIPEVTNKLRYLQQHPGKYDTLFLGSSRFYRQVSPEIFDREMRAAGFETRTFNFGVHGMGPWESSYLLEEIARRKPPGIRRVFLELTHLEKVIDEDKRDSLRAVYWHDWPRTRAACARLMFGGKRKRRWSNVPSRAWASRADLALHLKLMVENYTNLGRGPEIGMAAWRKSPTASAQDWPQADGYWPLPSTQLFPAAEEEDYHRRLLRIDPARTREKAAEPLLAAVLHDMTRTVRSLGAEAVVVVPPTVHALPWKLEGSNGEPPPPVLAFDDTGRDPDLFSPDHRADADHLNLVGSELFSRLLAERYAHFLLDRARTVAVPAP